MHLVYAVERLLDTGWTPTHDQDLEHLPDGRPYPSVLAVQQEFARAGLDLSIKHNLVFGCHRATWGPAGHPDMGESDDDRNGTVIGSCEREAAVYALSQLRELNAERQLGGLAIAEPQYAAASC